LAKTDPGALPSHHMVKDLKSRMRRKSSGGGRDGRKQVLS
jgi:hypothetical protein